MRKMKFLMALALLVFVFSGCGGSADNGEEESETDYHETVTNFLTGEWMFDSLAAHSGTITTARNLDLKDFGSFRMSFTDIEFGSNSRTASGKGKVYYSLTCTAGNSQEKIRITTYSGSAYKTMNLRRSSDSQWHFSDDDTDIYLSFDDDDEDMNVIISGTGDFEGLGENCAYTISGKFSKTSVNAIEDDSSLAPEEKEKTIKEILEGTWKFSQGDESGAKATSNTQGISAVLTLRLASDVYLSLSDINLEPDNNTTSLTGTVRVNYAQRWTAYNSTSNVMQGKEGAFAFSKLNEEMKIVQVDAKEWRIEDTENSNENIITTINSENEISTVWTGTTSATLVSTDSYTYDINCSFRKQ